MVKAWIEGRKTVTRRLVKAAIVPLLEKSCQVNGFPAIHLLDFDIKTPYEPGETVYVKEAWSVAAWRVGQVDLYYSDEKKPIAKNASAQFITSLDIDEHKWHPGKSNKYDPFRIRSPRFMPEWASRSHALIVSVRPERIKDITIEESMKEGFTLPLVCGFIPLWEKIHPGSWERNDWVWRIELEKK